MVTGQRLVTESGQKQKCLDARSNQLAEIRDQT
jgi:hypothetical protein